MNKENLILKYLSGLLNPGEQEEFDALLKSDPGFREEVLFQTDVKKAVTAEEDDAFRSMLAEFEADITSRRRFAVGNRMKWLVAASIAVIAALAYLLIPERAPQARELFASNFEPYKNVVYPTVRGSAGQGLESRAFSAYSRENYKEALDLFNSIPQSEAKPYYLFYKANALIATHNAREAIPFLKEYAGSRDSLVDKTAWYLAMAYLQLNELDLAEEALRAAIASDTGYKREEAQSLLKEVSRLRAEDH